jgi:hypothetical protein
MTFDYTCPQCGARETYSLVPTQGNAETEAPPRPAPELDFTCTSCGTTETFQLVKA